MNAAQAAAESESIIAGLHFCLTIFIKSEKSGGKIPPYLAKMRITEEGVKWGWQHPDRGAEEIDVIEGR